ncbi:TetR family transcriptional regulator [Natronomonas halophila]|uniref:TetR/AcrR family transcriptional regulator n=1 Tax=Natronomonas halophila TaxID=2747817 RepID=UPI0015B6D64D|nr:TetR/AcrR family transcriptional regulator [Natronomonas halophila]QLD85790.1 TetR family transcriptional regulator [Natronomonas halophila]
MVEETRERIMEATYRALCEHGYASLTMQDIADECDCSKSLLHYHFDTKEDLLVALLAYLLERFEERVATDGDPRDRLIDLVDAFLFGDERSREEHRAFHTALLELRAQAPHNDAFRDQLAENDAQIHATVAAVIDRGIDDGRFRNVDAARVSAHLLAAIQGARIRWVTLGHDTALEPVREALVSDVIDGWLVSG